MRFGYQPNVTLKPATGELQATWRPEIPLTVVGPSGTRMVVALVDTGSDETVISGTLARAIGLSVSNAEGPTANSVTGEEIPLQMTTCEFVLLAEEESLRWAADVFVFEFESPEHETTLLGHRGFLEFMVATFHGEARTLDLVPNGQFPGTHVRHAPDAHGASAEGS